MQPLGKYIHISEGNFEDWVLTRNNSKKEESSLCPKTVVPIG